MQDAPTNRRSTNSALPVASAAATLAAVAILLRRFPPQTASFYPRCPIHAVTGLLCPGCGATRALAALAHGNLTEALHHNPLAVFALATLIAWPALARLTPPRRPGFHPSPVLITLALACTAAFTLYRNLP